MCYWPIADPGTRDCEHAEAVHAVSLSLEEARQTWARTKKSVDGPIVIDDVLSRATSRKDLLDGYLGLAGRSGPFLGHEFNVLQRQALLRKETTITAPSDATDTYITKMVQQLTAENAAGAKPGTSSSDTARLVKDVDLIAARVVGFGQQRTGKRKYPLAMMVRHGTAQLFLTISPSAKEALPCFKLTSTLRPGDPAMRVRLCVPCTYPNAKDRTERVTNDGAACKEYYFRTCHAYLVAFLGYDPTERCFIPGAGIFGDVQAFTACTEAQQSENLHMHLQASIRGLDQRQLHTHLTDPAYQAGLFAYLNSVVSERLPSVLADETRACLRWTHRVQQRLLRLAPGLPDNKMMRVTKAAHALATRSAELSGLDFMPRVLQPAGGRAAVHRVFANVSGVGPDTAGYVADVCEALAAEGAASTAPDDVPVGGIATAPKVSVARGPTRAALAPAEAAVVVVAGTADILVQPCASHVSPDVAHGLVREFKATIMSGDAVKNSAPCSDAHNGDVHGADETVGMLCGCEQGTWLGDGDVDADEEFDVESVVAKRIKDGVLEYRVRWVGYPPEEDTWQPSSTLDGARGCVREFNASQIGDAVNEGHTSRGALGVVPRPMVLDEEPAELAGDGCAQGAGAQPAFIDDNVTAPRETRGVGVHATGIVEDRECAVPARASLPPSSSTLPADATLMFRPAPNQTVLLEVVDEHGDTLCVPAHIVRCTVEEGVATACVEAWDIRKVECADAYLEFGPCTREDEAAGIYSAMLSWAPEPTRDDDRTEPRLRVPCRHKSERVVVKACHGCNALKGGSSALKNKKCLFVREKDPLATLLDKFYKGCKSSPSQTSPQSLPLLPRDKMPRGWTYEQYLAFREAAAVQCEYFHGHNSNYCLIKGHRRGATAVSPGGALGELFCKARFPRACRTDAQAFGLALIQGILRLARDHQYMVPHNPTATTALPCNQSLELDLDGLTSLKHAFYHASYHVKSSFSYSQTCEWRQGYHSTLARKEVRILQASVGDPLGVVKRTRNAVLADFLRRQQYGSPMMAMWLAEETSSWRQDFLVSFETAQLHVPPFVPRNDSNRRPIGLVRALGGNAGFTTKLGFAFQYEHRGDALEGMSPYQVCMQGSMVKLGARGSLKQGFLEFINERLDGSHLTPLQMSASCADEDSEVDEWGRLQKAVDDGSLTHLAPAALAQWNEEQRAPMLDDDEGDSGRAALRRGVGETVLQHARTRLEELLGHTSVLDGVVDGLCLYRDGFAGASQYAWKYRKKDTTPVLVPGMVGYLTTPGPFAKLLHKLDGTGWLGDCGVRVGGESIMALTVPPSLAVRPPLYPCLDDDLGRLVKAAETACSPSGALGRTPVQTRLLDALARFKAASALHNWDDSEAIWPITAAALGKLEVYTATDDILRVVREHIRDLETEDGFGPDDAVAMEGYSRATLGLFSSHRRDTRPADGVDVPQLLNWTESLCGLMCVWRRCAPLVYRGERIWLRGRGTDAEPAGVVPLKPGARVLVRAMCAQSAWDREVLGCASPGPHPPVGDTAPSPGDERGPDGLNPGRCALCEREARTLVGGVCIECPRVAIVVAANAGDGSGDVRASADRANHEVRVEYVTLVRGDDSVVRVGGRVGGVEAAVDRARLIRTDLIERTYSSVLDWRPVIERPKLSGEVAAEGEVDADSILRAANRKAGVLDVLGCGRQRSDHSEGVVVQVESTPVGNGHGWFVVSIPQALGRRDSQPLCTLELRVMDCEYNPRTCIYDYFVGDLRCVGSTAADEVVRVEGGLEGGRGGGRVETGTPARILRRRFTARQHLDWVRNIEGIRIGADAAEKERQREEARHQEGTGEVVSYDSTRVQRDDAPVDHGAESRIVAQINQRLEGELNVEPRHDADTDAIHSALSNARVGAVGASGAFGACAPRGVSPIQDRTSIDCGCGKRRRPTAVRMAAALDAAGAPSLEPEPAVPDPWTSRMDVEPTVNENPAGDAHAFDIEHIIDTGANGAPFAEEARNMLEQTLCKVMKCDECGLLCDRRRPEALGRTGPVVLGAELKCRLCSVGDWLTCRMCSEPTARAEYCSGALCALCDVENSALPCDEQYGPLEEGGRSPCSTILVGSPGVGKTLVIRAITAAHAANGMQDQLVVCAKLGAAAANVGGLTFDSMLKSSIGNPSRLAPLSGLKYLKSVRTCIWDEVYTSRLPELDKMDRSFRRLFGEDQGAFGCMPFGGRHMLFAGDPNQLAPVRGQDTALYAFAYEHAFHSDAHLAAREAAKARGPTSGRRSDSEARIFGMWMHWVGIRDVHILHRQYRLRDPELQGIVHDFRTGLRDYPEPHRRTARIDAICAWWNAKCWGLHPALVDNSPPWTTCPCIVGWNKQAEILGVARLLHYAHCERKQVFGYRARDRGTHSRGAFLSGVAKCRAAAQVTQRCESCPFRFYYAEGYRYRLRVSGGCAGPLSKQRPKVRYCNNQLGTARGIELDRELELKRARAPDSSFTAAQCVDWDCYVAASRTKDPGGVVWLLEPPVCVYFEPDDATHVPLSDEFLDDTIRALHPMCFRIQPQVVTFKLKLSEADKRKCADIPSATGKPGVAGFPVSRTNVRLLPIGGSTDHCVMGLTVERALWAPLEKQVALSGRGGLTVAASRADAHHVATLTEVTPKMIMACVSKAYNPPKRVPVELNQDVESDRLDAVCAERKLAFIARNGAHLRNVVGLAPRASEAGAVDRLFARQQVQLDHLSGRDGPCQARWTVADGMGVKARGGGAIGETAPVVRVDQLRARVAELRAQLATRRGPLGVDDPGRLVSYDVGSRDGGHAGDTATTPTLKRRRSVPPLVDAAGVRTGRGDACSGSFRRLRPRVLQLTSPPASAEGAGGGDGGGTGSPAADFEAAARPASRFHRDRECSRAARVLNVTRAVFACAGKAAWFEGFSTIEGIRLVEEATRPIESVVLDPAFRALFDSAEPTAMTEILVVVRVLAAHPDFNDSAALKPAWTDAQARDFLARRHPDFARRDAR